MPNAILSLSKAFWGVCTFRLGPQDIPFSPALLALATAANMLSSIAINQVRPLVNASLETVVLFGLTSAVLYSTSRTRRIVQTVTALMGSGAVLGVIVLVLFLIMPQIPLPLRIGVLVWNLFIMAHILRHALDTHLMVGLLIAVGYMFTMNQLMVYVAHLLSTANA